MQFRSTLGIFTDATDPHKDADVIMTAAALGLAADYIAKKKKPIQFDQDPTTPVLQADAFNKTVAKMDAAVAAYLKKEKLEPGVKAGTSPGYTQGAVIMGVYTLAGQTRPESISKPELSPAGLDLWKNIAVLSPLAGEQYTGWGAYTGFVDNKNTDPGVPHNPIGPRSTIRQTAPAAGIPAPTEAPHPRWLPPSKSPLWTARKRKVEGTFVPWGLISGDKAAEPAHPGHQSKATNLADQETWEMQNVFKMPFAGNVTNADIATYVHGMIQAIYKAYTLGPSCVPYEIAVGDKTKKMASCLACTLFMYASEYPPTSTHLGRAESWAPQYAPYNPPGPGQPPSALGEFNELAVIRDLNNRWYEKCLEWLLKGVAILDDDHIAPDHKESRNALKTYLDDHADPVKGGDDTVAGVLVLDALTVHDTEINRLTRTLK
jgi:hypothetical protein